MTLLGSVRLAVKSLFWGPNGAVLRGRDTAALACIAVLGAVSFLFESFGLFGLMSLAFGGTHTTLTIGALLGVPATSGFLATALRPGVVFGFVIAKMVLNPILYYALQAMAERTAHRFRIQLLSLATALPAINAGAIPSGELTAIINDETSRCGRAVVSIVSSFQLIAGVAFSTAFLIVRDPRLNLAAILCTLPAMGLYVAVAARNSKDTRKVVEARVRAASKVTEGLRSLAGIKAVGGGAELTQTLGEAAEEMRFRETKIYFNQSLLQGAMSLVPIVAAVGALGYVWFIMGLHTAGTIAAALMPTAVVGGRVAAASSGVVMNVYSTSIYATSFIPVMDLFARLTKLGRRGGAEPSLVAGEKQRWLDRIELRDCSFQLPNGVWLFRDLSISAAPELPIVVRGASGTGKSTLASIIAGANEPTAGTIIYTLSDGTQVPPHEAYMNYLSQDPAVIAGSVRENLRLGAGSLTDEVLVDALKQVRLWDEFGPKGGLDAPIFEGGRNLSGGQIRRLGLARLLTRDKGLWIFDEATASLDPTSKAIVEEFIRNMAKTRTLLIITHDPEFRIGGSEIELFHNASARLHSAA